MVQADIGDGIRWVGVQNPDLRIFDVVMRTEWGTSYNSYLIQGSEKTAIIDPVKEQYALEQIAKIGAYCDPAQIDYIICNHTEPDHSGSLDKLLTIAPNATVVCSSVGATYLEAMLNHKFKVRTVKDGDTLSLGGKTLRFLSVPFLHWPDSIFTYAEEDRILFPCDMFGFHFSAERIFDDLTPLDGEMLASQKYYFDVIMSPFKKYVRNAIDKIRDLPIQVICPSHGPVLRQDPWGAVARYEAWAAEPAPVEPKRVFIGYVSCYGYTRLLAEEIYERCVRAGLNASLEELSELSAEEAAARITAADGVALGTPTVNRDALKPVWDVLTSLSPILCQGKPGVAFGSYGWSGEGVRFVAARMKDLGFQLQAQVSARFRPNAEELALAAQAGDALAKCCK